MTISFNIRQVKYITTILLGVFGMWLSPVHATTEQALFLHARSAFTNHHLIALKDDVAELKRTESVFLPIADAWLMQLRIHQSNNVNEDDIQAYLTQNAQTAFAERIRGEWLKKLARNQQWQPFFVHYAQYQREDTAVLCYALQGNIALNQTTEVIAKIKSLWLTTQDLPSSCNPLFEHAIKVDALKKEDILARLRLALEDNKISLAKSILPKLAGIATRDAALIDRAAKSPQHVLNHEIFSLQTDYGIELNLFALDRLAKTNLEEAIKYFQKVQMQYPSQARAFGWSRIALQAAHAHHVDALKYYALAEQSFINDKEQLAWYARAALRASDWKQVLSAIQLMSPAQAEEGAWRYWKARALQTQNASLEAQSLYSQLSTERHFYGWLASEELDASLTSPLASYEVEEADVQVVANTPGIKRAMALNQLDLRWDAKVEWLSAIKQFDDKRVIAAAEYAMRQQWYDVAIATADSTKQIHNFSLRYPSPYRDLMGLAAKNETIDEAWMHGLIRQESRFMHFAKSNVGASGLMQLMPATAKWAAQRMGKNDYSASQIHELNTNIAIGAYYMRYTLELMNGQAVMATAAYNAGPSRAKKWQANTPLEAAIYIETIPFSETRNYVQKVMANAHIYAPRLGTPIKTLKARLGAIPAKVQ